MRPTSKIWQVGEGGESATRRNEENSTRFASLGFNKYGSPRALTSRYILMSSHEHVYELIIEINVDLIVGY